MQDPNRNRLPRNPFTGGGDRNDKNEKGSPSRRPRIPTWFVGLLLVIIAVWYAYQFMSPNDDDSRVTVDYSIALEQIQQNNVDSATIGTTNLEVDLKSPVRWDGDANDGRGAVVPDNAENADDFRQTSKLKAKIPTNLRNENPELTALLEQNQVSYRGKDENGSVLTSLLINFLPIIFIIALIIFMSRQMTRGQQNVFGFGRSRARLNDPERPQVTFADVAGEEEAKKELTEVVDFLRNPAKYHQLGARLPRGVLLVGPPGTGKTLTARAVAGEAGVPFFSISASEFVEMFVGVGASRVRDLFDRAKTMHPSIIFIDELDAVGRQRFAGLGGSNDEREQTLNQLLVEMDGFDTDQEVIVMAATNRPDVLDPALLRPGRFDRQVVVGLPDRKGREAILTIHTRGIPVAKEVDLPGIARATTGFSGADLSNLVNEAALMAARKNRKEILNSDFDEALDKILLGTMRSLVMSPDERKVTAIHEAGHALVAHLSVGAHPLRKVTIVPRGRAMGVVMMTPEDDRYSESREGLGAHLRVSLAGRGAEMVRCDDITTGAESDLKGATSLARRMVGIWGMSDEVGPVYLGAGEEHVFLGREIVQDKAYSDATAQRVDTAVRHLIEKALQEAMAMISEHSEKLDRLVEQLLEKETLDAVEVTEILGPRPKGSRSDVEVTVPPSTVHSPLVGEPIPSGSLPEQN
jgi:cell division protease FtsH